MRVGRAGARKRPYQLVEPLAVDRLGEIACRTKRDASAVFIHDRHHDHWNLGKLGVLPQCSQYRPAIEVGHHDVERNGDRPQFLCKLQSLQSAGSRGY